MCSISLVFDATARGDIRDRILKMNRAGTHRGPDGSGIEIVGAIGLGHTRLSIIDLTSGGHQPMMRDGHLISFNGEIYNYQDIRQKLEIKGVHFSTRSDTEVLLKALLHWGLAALEQLKGMFAFCYLDQLRGEIYLVRDRFGKKPLNVLIDKNGLVAASEIKQILAQRNEKVGARVETVLSFLEHGALNEHDGTFFEGIEQVPAGCYIKYSIESGKRTTVRWYDLASRINASSDSYVDARERVQELLKTAVLRRHVSDVEVGACLSGGLDSSSIVCLSAENFPSRKLKVISAYAPIQGCDERHFSRIVVRKYGLESIEVCFDPLAVWQEQSLREMCYYQDQPIISGSQFAEYSVFKAARAAGIVVMLDGQGADEYFGGYSEFWYAAQLELLKKGALKTFIEALKARADSRGIAVNRVLLEFTASFFRRSQSYRRRTLNSEQEDAMRQRAQLACSVRDGRQPFDALALEEMTFSSLPFQVHSEDRSSMRCSVESRLPFLDHDLVEYVMGLPVSYRCDRGIQKTLLRDAMSCLPHEIAHRKDKIGFASPDGHTCFKHSIDIRKKVVDASHRLDALLVPEAVGKAFDCMIATRRYSDFFLRVLALDAWTQAFGCKV